VQQKENQSIKTKSGVENKAIWGFNYLKIIGEYAKIIISSQYKPRMKASNYHDSHFQQFSGLFPGGND